MAQTMPGTEKTQLATKSTALQARDPSTFRLEPGASIRRVFVAPRLKRAGLTEFAIEAASKQAYSRRIKTLLVKPRGHRRRHIKQIKIAGRERMILNKELAAEPDQSPQSLHLWASNHPNTEIYSHLDYLVTYPFGCLEQTTSGTTTAVLKSFIAGPKQTPRARRPALTKRSPWGLSAYYQCKRRTVA